MFAVVVERRQKKKGVYVLPVERVAKTLKQKINEKEYTFISQEISLKICVKLKIFVLK